MQGKVKFLLTLLDPVPTYVHSYNVATYTTIDGYINTTENHLSVNLLLLSYSRQLPCIATLQGFLSALACNLQ